MAYGIFFRRPASSVVPLRLPKATPLGLVALLQMPGVAQKAMKSQAKARDETASRGERVDRDGLCPFGLCPQKAWSVVVMKAL